MNKREYAQANKDWLESKAREDGVKALPKGIYYKVITEGNNDGKHPTPRSVVTAHYAGWTINGKKFDICASATNGKYTFLPNWATADSLSPAFPPAQLLYSK